MHPHWEERSRCKEVDLRPCLRLAISVLGLSNLESFVMGENPNAYNKWTNNNLTRRLRPVSVLWALGLTVQ